MSWHLAVLLGALSVTNAGDRVDVRDGGSVVASFVPATPAAKRGPAQAKLVTAAGHELVEIRLPLTGGGGRAELWLGERGARAPVWTGLVGPTDGDGETGRELAVTADGVELYQTAARLSRCDGAPVRLFRERWDFAQRKFRPAPPALPGPGQALRAKRGDPEMPAGKPLGGYFWTAASSTAGARDARSLAAPWALNDGDPGTTWSTAGDGRGEWVSARASTTGTSVVGLRLGPGPEAFRPRKVTLILGPADDQRFDVEIPDGTGPAWVRLPRPVASSCATVVVREPGRNGAAAIGDLDVFTELDGPDGIARLVEAVRGGTDCEAKVPLLTGLGDAAANPVAAAIQKGPGPGRECLLSVLDGLKGVGTNPAARMATVAALERSTPAEERLILGLLPRFEPPPIAALSEVLGADARPDADRLRAARGLATLDRAEAWEALVAAAGHGPAPLRTGLRELLAGAKVPLAAAVREALAGETAPVRRADLIFVLGAAAAREPEQRARSLELLRPAAAAPEFEVVARSIAALGRIGDDVAVAELSRIRAHSTDAVVRYLATRELASAKAAAALGAVRAALDDGDPRVRETAALALGHRRDGSSAGRLVAAAKQEPWPFVRRAQVTALGAMCEAGDLLVRADERDVPEVRREALIGLARCRDGRAPGLLLRALGRREEDPEIRSLAASLLGTLKDPRLARPFAEALARLRVEAQEDLALEGVTVVGMQSLARMGGPEAVGAALQLLGDERLLFKRTGLEALGQLCDPGRGAAAVAAAMRDKDPSVAAAASAAHRRCQARPRP